MTLVGTPNVIETADSSYADYADNFDLSLLSMDNEFNTLVNGKRVLTGSLIYLGHWPASPPHLDIRWSEMENFTNLKTDNSYFLNAANSEADFIPTTVFEKWNTYQSQQSMQQEQIPLIFPPSPTPSIELSTYNCNIIRSEQSPNANFHLYPPSPPDSNGAPSPVGCQYIDVKMSDPAYSSQSDLFSDAPKKDYQLLREHLQDLSFQKKHNLKPLPLESLFADDWDVQDDIEPVISLALEQARKDVEQTCLTLNISSGKNRTQDTHTHTQPREKTKRVFYCEHFNLRQFLTFLFRTIFIGLVLGFLLDPLEWSRDQVRAWLQFTMKQFKITLTQEIESIFDEDGKQLSRLNEMDFINRIPEVNLIRHMMDAQI